MEPLKDDNDRDLLNAKITYDEAYECIKRMSAAAPGANGLTIGFFKKYFPYFGKYYVEMVNSGDPLPNCFKESVIKLLPKNNSKVKTVNDLRPISLTNYEYRIFTKILANRIRKVSMKLVGDNQTCSIKGRRINDNINLIKDILCDANIKNKELYLISVDQSKAFDSLSHNYMFKLLEHLNLGEFFINSIRRVYDNSFACLEVNKKKSKRINIKSGVKQGCPLSMIIYILCIEEPIVRIQNNEQIVGYTLNVTEKYENKVSGYADDLNGILTKFDSIKEFFKELNDWSSVSGAKINENKTQILAVNNYSEQYENIKFINSLKLLGIIFDRNGLSNENISKTVTKIEKGLCLWDLVKMNMLERIVVCKTFLLSKLWYIANFMVIGEKTIRKLERMLFSFIWNGSIESVKRGTLFLPLERGGLNMMSIRARLKTIMFQNYAYIIKNKERAAYQACIFWMKMCMKDHLTINFNIIPQGMDRDRPLYYTRMIECVKKIKEIDSEYLNNISECKSKITYRYFVKEYYIKPKVESKYKVCDWGEIYKNSLINTQWSDLQVFNYKVLFDALPCNQRFNNRIKNKCYLCNRSGETRDHLFVHCPVTIDLFAGIKVFLLKQDLVLDHNIIMSVSLAKPDLRIISIFKYALWSLRNKCRISSVENKNIVFENLFKFYLKKFFWP
jgi:hypothetical protein